MARPTPINAEAEFGIEELFFSVTDKRGLIQSGNTVFQRVSQYASSELIGQPHNLIRHPDMPRAVFWLLWETIKAGKPISAYVKNLAKDGKYYWVLANVFPIQDAYLSVRIKPSSPILKVIPDLYKKMLTAEFAAREDNPIAAGVAVLQEALGSLGYANYDAFMIDVLTTELESREKIISSTGLKAQASIDMFSTECLLGKLTNMCTTINREYSTLFSNLGQFSQLGGTLTSKAKFIMKLTEQIATLALNTTVQAARVGSEAASMGVISRELTEQSVDLKHRVEKTSSAINTMKEGVRLVQFNMSVVKLQVEMINFFLDEWKNQMGTTESGHNLEQEYTAKCGILFGVLNQYLNSAMQELEKFIEQSTNTEVSFASLERLVMALEIIRKTGTIESAKLGAHQASFGGLFQQMGGSVQSARKEINEFSETLAHQAGVVRETKEVSSGTVLPLVDNVRHAMSL